MKEIKAKIEQNKADQQKLRDEGVRLKKELKDSEVTYSIGDRFIDGCEKLILVRAEVNKVQLACLYDGDYWCHGHPIEVKNVRQITQAEIIQIFKDENFTRYQTTRKGCNV